MNKREAKKYKKKMILLLLERAVGLLDDEKRNYHARVQRIPFSELRTIKEINGYRLEIRTSREEKHNYAHFHVVKGTDGMASIRIDTMDVQKSSLPKKDLKKILEWAKSNKDILAATWNEFHGHRIVVE